uniref:PDZ domain-containing protein n=1 Tax=Rhabditophanes sp. KR3021 TaxID=114890 RepID=A0AC35THJ9_9BILA
MSAGPNDSPELKEGCAPVKTITITIPMEEGDPIGATPNERMVIVKVQPNTLSDGKIQIGDKILTLNGAIVKDPNHFYNLLRFVRNEASITVERDDNRSQKMHGKIMIPADRMRNIQNRDGYLYFLATVNLQEGKKLGLGIRHFQNRVLVSKCEPGSISDEILKIGDHVCDVQQIVVTDKDVCRRLLVTSLQES